MEKNKHDLIYSFTEERRSGCTDRSDYVMVVIQQVKVVEIKIHTANDVLSKVNFQFGSISITRIQIARLSDLLVHR